LLSETSHIELSQKGINSISTQWIHYGVVLSALLSKFKLLPAFALSPSLVSRQRITTKDIGSAYVSARLKVDKEVKQNAVKMLNFILHCYYLKSIIFICTAILVILELFYTIYDNNKLRNVLLKNLFYKHFNKCNQFEQKKDTITKI